MVSSLSSLSLLSLCLVGAFVPVRVEGGREGKDSVCLTGGKLMHEAWP